MGPLVYFCSFAGCYLRIVDSLGSLVVTVSFTFDGVSGGDSSPVPFSAWHLNFIQTALVGK